MYVVHIKTSVIVVEITGMLYTRHHKWLTLDVIYLLHGTKVTREKIALVSPLKLPCMATHIKPGILEAGKIGYLYMRHRKIRDQRVVYNVQLYHKRLEPDVRYRSY